MTTTLDDLARVCAALPLLGVDGFTDDPEERRLGGAHLAEIDRARAWIRTNPELALKRGSYAGKHLAESPRHYVSNGAFLAALVLEGYCVVRLPGTPNGVPLRHDATASERRTRLVEVGFSSDILDLVQVAMLVREATRRNPRLRIAADRIIASYARRNRFSNDELEAAHAALAVVGEPPTSIVPCRAVDVPTGIAALHALHALEA